MRYALAALLLSASTASIGCGAGGTDALRRRAAFDLSCPAESIQIVDLGGAHGVTGCGKKATYISSCSAAQRDMAMSDDQCPWKMNMDATAAPATSQ